MKQQRRKGNWADLFPHSSTHIVNAVCLVLILGFHARAGSPPDRFVISMGWTTEASPSEHHPQSETRKTEAEINSYVTGLKRFTNGNIRSRRIFADVAGENDDRPKWREFKTKREFDKFEGNPDQSAFVWTRVGKLIAAAFTFTSSSGDWAHLVTYYFREDGSLAKIEAQLNTFYGNVSVVRDLWFNDAGTQISSTKEILDLKTQKPIKKPADFFDQEVTVFRTTTDLPFHKLL